MIVEREPCSACGEAVSLDARICPHCRSSALVDVVLNAPMTDGRLRFKVARALQALSPPLPPPSDTQAALLARPPVVARGVTRSFGYRVLEVLEANGSGGLFEAAATARGGLPARSLLLGAGVAAAFVAGWLVLRSGERGPTEPPAQETADRPTAVAAPLGGAPRKALSTEELARRCLPSAVSLRKGSRLGSGFFVDADQILTNAHVAGVVGETLRVLLPDGKELEGTVTRSDESIDLALVKTSGPGGSALPLGDAGALAVGQKLVLIGNPVGLDFTVHEGTVSSLSRSYLGVAYIQLDAKVNPGNSGGPLIDDQGRVVGIVSMKITEAEGIGLALPINYAYTASGFVPPPSGAEGGGGFRAMLAGAEAADGEARSEVAALELLPGIVGATVDEYQRLVVRVVRPARSPPGFEEVTVKVWRGGETFCTLKGDITEWKVVEGKGVSAEPRVAAWLDRIGLNVTFHVGEAALRWDQCPREKVTPGIELELEGGDPSVGRLRLH